MDNKTTDGVPVAAGLPVIDYVAIGKRIRKVRKHRHLTQVELGKAIGKSSSFLGHIERGTRKASIETVIHIAVVLDASLDEILVGVSKQPALWEKDHLRNNDTPKSRMLMDIMRVLHAHADEWMSGG